MEETLREAAEQIVEDADYNKTKQGIVADIRRLAFKFGPEGIPGLDKEHYAKALGHSDSDIVRVVAEVLMEEE